MFSYYPVNFLHEGTLYLWTKILLTCSSNRFLICSETVLTNSTSLSMQKSHWNLNHHLWNWRLFTCSLKMAVAPKPNEIFHSTNGRENFYLCSSTALKLWVSKYRLWNKTKENQMMSVCSYYLWKDTIRSFMRSVLLLRELFGQINPSTPMSDQDRISPYNINAILTR